MSFDYRNLLPKDLTERRYLPSKDDVIKKYIFLQKQNKNILNEDSKNKVDNLLKRSNKSTKQQTINVKNWELKLTEYGVFYYNKETNQWMNNFGVIKNSLGEFFNSFSFVTDNSDNSKNNQQYTIVAWGNNDWQQLEVPITITNAQKVTTPALGVIVTLNNNSIKIWGQDIANNAYPNPLPQNPIFISGGYDYSLAIQDDNTIYGWAVSFAGNDEGQANPPGGLTGIIHVDANNKTSAALDESGNVYFWGNNSYGQTDIPVGINPCIDVCAGWNHSCAIENDGTILCWGDNTSGQCNIPAGITASKISAGENFTCVLKSDGSVECWGINTANQCDVPAGLSSVIKITCGPAHTIALKSDGTAVAWGYNENLQCNVSNYTNVVDVDAGLLHSALVLANGEIKIASNNTSLQPPTTLQKVIDIKANYRFIFALQANGSAKCWGARTSPFQATDIIKIAVGKEDGLYAIRSNNILITSGDYNISDPDTVLRPVPIPNAIDVDGGYQHSIVLKPDGTVVCWGWNFYNQCTVPPGLSDVVQVTATNYASFALKSDGTIVSWGGNNFGERNIPGGLSDVIKISGGWYHVIALKADGTVVCWGENADGQCNIPAGLSNVVDITAGWKNSGVIKSDKSIICWGDNSDGQLNIPSGIQNNVNKLDCRGKTFVLLRD